MNLTTHPQSTPKVSVVIPCYNVAPFLTRAVNSIRNQTFHDWEMILVDDGSTDATPKVAQQLAQEDPRIRLLKHHTNKGPGATRNTGIAQAKAEYITLLDADDEFMPTYLEKAVKILDEQEIVQLVQTDFIWSPERYKELHRFPENFSIQEHLEVMHLKTCLTFRKNCWQQVGGFDERIRFGEDWHYMLKLHTQNLLHYAVIKEPLFKYYKDNPNSITASAKPKVIRKSHRFIYDEFSSLYDQHMKPLFRRITGGWLGNVRLPPRHVTMHPIRWAAQKNLTYFLLFWCVYLAKWPGYLMYLWARTGKRIVMFLLAQLKQT